MNKSKRGRGKENVAAVTEVI